MIASGMKMVSKKFSAVRSSRMKQKLQTVFVLSFDVGIWGKLERANEKVENS
jgi:hypothetical protein